MDILVLHHPLRVAAAHPDRHAQGAGAVLTRGPDRKRAPYGALFHWRVPMAPSE